MGVAIALFLIFILGVASLFFVVALVEEIMMNTGVRKRNTGSYDLIDKRLHHLEQMIVENHGSSIDAHNALEDRVSKLETSIPKRKKKGKVK